MTPRLKVGFTSAWTARVRPLVVPVLAAFLSFVFAAVKPVSRQGGEYGFLVYTALLLFFFPRGQVADQIEATVLGLLGTVVGLAWSNVLLAIAAYCGRRYGPDGDAARVVLGGGLALLALLGGYLRSWSPRLTAASRAMLFFSIFLLTAQQAITKMQYRLFTEQFIVACYAAGVALVPALVFGRRSSGPHLGQSLLQSIDTASIILSQSLELILDTGNPKHDEASKQSIPSLTTQVASFRNQIVDLQQLQSRYCYEVVRTRVPPASLQPVLSCLAHLQRNPLLGHPTHAPGERIRAALERTHTRHLHDWRTNLPLRSETPTTRHARSRPPSSESSLVAMDLQERRGRTRSFPSASRFSHLHSRSDSRSSFRHALPSLVIACRATCKAVQDVLAWSAESLAGSYDWPLPVTSSERANKDARDALAATLIELRRELSRLVDLHVPTLPSTDSSPVSARQPSPVSTTHAEAESEGIHDRFRLAFHMTALFDLAKTVLQLAEDVERIAKRAKGPKQWRWPPFPSTRRSAAELTPVSSEGHGNGLHFVEDDRDYDKDNNETFLEEDYVTAALHRERHQNQEGILPSGWMARLGHAWRHAWDQRSVLKARVLVSHSWHALRHSPHVRFALKQAAGISLLALPAWLPPDTPGRRWFNNTRAAWTVISYMFVLEVHTGATLTVGVLRMIGTFIGATFAFVFTLIAKDNPYAIVALATLASVPISYNILFSAYPAVGVVTGITLPPLLFLTYLGLDNGQSPFYLAWTRFVDITIGIGAAVIVGTLVWPNHARVRYFRALSATLDRTTEYYLRMSRDNLRASLVYQDNSHQYAQAEASVRKSIEVSRNLIDIQRREPSLLPRPIRLYSEIVDGAERLMDMFAEVRTLRFSVPRKESVLDVLPIRQELVSAVLINLWALSQAFRSRSPLPQFLPNPREALAQLMHAIDEYASLPLARDTTTGASKDADQAKLAVLYGMAENEAMGEAFDVLDELVVAARTLFGSKTFLDAGGRAQRL